MVAALDDAALLDHKNLVGAANGRQAMGDDERRAALHQLGKPALDHRLRFGIERTGGFVENEDARLGQESPCNRQPLPLPAAELHPALTHDGVVSLREALCKLVDARRAAGKLKLLLGRAGPREKDVLANRAIKEK